MIEGKDKGIHTLNQWIIKNWKDMAKINRVYTRYVLRRYHNFESSGFEGANGGTQLSVNY